MRQNLGRIPANAHQDHIDWETHSFGIEHGRSTQSVDSRVAYDLGVIAQCDRTELARNSCLSGYMTSTADHNARTSR